MTLKELWMLSEADKRILGFSSHTMKAYFLQLNMLIRELGNLEIEEISLKCSPVTDIVSCFRERQCSRACPSKIRSPLRLQAQPLVG